MSASSAATVCSSEAIETRPSLRMPATVASTPGWSSTSSVIWYRVVTRPTGTMGRFASVDSPTPTPPAMWRRAADTTSPSTADAVCTPPALAPGEQLDDVPGVARSIHHRLVDRGDALAVHRLQRHCRVEREARQDRGLLRGVVAFDVRGRVGLGVPEALRVREHVGEL